MEIEIKKPVATGATAAPAVSAQTLTAVVPVTAQPVVVAQPILGDYLPEFVDVALPSVALVHDISDLSKAFTPGAIVFDGKLVLYSPADPRAKTEATPPFIAQMLGLVDKGFEEVTKGNAQGIRITAKGKAKGAAEAEVVAAGGTLVYNESNSDEGKGNTKKWFKPYAKFMLAIKRPAGAKDDGTVFVHQVDDNKVALAFWTFKKTAYNAACEKALFLHRLTGCLKAGGYPSWTYQVSSFLRKGFKGGPDYFVPQLTPNMPSTKAELALVSEILGAPAE